MAKSKRSPALFELIGQGKSHKEPDKLAIPKWFQRSKATSQPAARPSPTAPQPSVPTAMPTTKAPAGTAESMDGGQPLFRVQGGRVILSLSAVNAIVAGGVILLALFASFLVGQQFGGRTPAPVTDDIQAALNQPTDGSTLDVGRPSGKTASSGPDKITDAPSSPSAGQAGGTAGIQETGLNHVAIQDFKLQDKKSAEHVQKWLLDSYQLETEIQRSGNYWRLLTVQGFDYSLPGQEEACKSFLKEIQAHGQECAAELRKAGLAVYDLRDPYVKLKK